MEQLIKFNDKGFLREHPFLNPIDQPTPIQRHSYIFPGDEIVPYHIISLPDDLTSVLGSFVITDVKFLSAKVSLIAQKPNVFSEEFSREFQATRNFELDSFTVAFNNLNAMLIPFGTDGYAPNLLIQQDRGFKLPPGDFRRQINFYTKHTAATSKWDYYFQFPLLFRWEYWIALLGADADFFDVTQANNNQNQFWYHYFIASTWIFKSRLELHLLVKGQEILVRNDLNLSPGSSDILTYNSNSDWTNKSIKTCDIGGTPSNTPCVIKGNEDTEVFAYFRKQTGWLGSEQTKISVVIWVEPFESSGVTTRTRASSVFQATDESVFYGLLTSITDDSGLGVQDEAGNYIVIDNIGNGVRVFFDALDAAQVYAFALIDKNKLNRIYPGVNKFTVYARLYNSHIIAGETKKGEEIKQDAILVSELDISTVCEPIAPFCPFALDVFADVADAADIKNDLSDFYEYGSALISNISFQLQKNNDLCGSAWASIGSVIADNTYGNYFSFGNSPNFSGLTFTDDYEKKYTGLLLQWRKVLTLHGVGQYRMKIDRLDVFGNTTTTYDNRLFCLKAYNCNLIDRSVRIETVNVGLRGSFMDATALTDYGSSWKGQIRLRGVLKYKSSTYEIESSEYGESAMNALSPFINKQTPKLILSVRPVPGWMDFLLSTNVFQADEIYITDYNTRNRHTLIKKRVMIDGEFAPVDNSLLNPLSTIDIPLTYALNNLRKRNSQ